LHGTVDREGEADDCSPELEPHGQRWDEGSQGHSTGSSQDTDGVSVVVVVDVHRFEIQPVFPEAVVLIQFTSFGVPSFAV
jgi:hypothetical protein